jgi:membrane-associated protease RseP (regulator of RpoE activity)
MRPKTITVLRSADTLRFDFDHKFIPQLIKSRGLFERNTPFVVFEVTDTSPNQTAGLIPGDRLITLNNLCANTFAQAQRIFKQHAGDSVIAVFDRGGAWVTIPLFVDNNGFI